MADAINDFATCDTLPQPVKGDGYSLTVDAGRGKARFDVWTDVAHLSYPLHTKGLNGDRIRSVAAAMRERLGDLPQIAALESESLSHIDG